MPERRWLVGGATAALFVVAASQFSVAAFTTAAPPPLVTEDVRERFIDIQEFRSQGGGWTSRTEIVR